MNNDLISREALKKKLSGENYQTYTHEYGYAIPTEWVMNAIDNAPTVEAYTPKQVKELVDLNKKLSEERPQGEWVEGWDGYFETLDCSLCGYVRNERHLRLNYCPNCGAKMREGDLSGK